jgi:hypothetical protein
MTMDPVETLTDGEKRAGEVDDEEDEVAVESSKSTAVTPEDSIATDDLPELLDLIDLIEGAAEDAVDLSAVIQKIGRRIRCTPGDRELLTDFEGVAQICQALASPPHEWRGQAMLTFCRVMPEICRTSTLNRGALRDEGFVAAAVAFLRDSISSVRNSDPQNTVGTQEELPIIAAAVALNATCTGNDGNKRIAASLAQLETENASSEKPGAIHLLLDVLELFPASLSVQTEAMAALRSLLTDDDSRKADCVPAAVENRELVLSGDLFQKARASVERALGSPEPLPVKLLEQTLLLLREIARGEERIHDLAFGAKLLRRSQEWVEKSEDARVVRAALSVLRAFSFHDEVRDELAILSSGAENCVIAVQRHIATPTVCEQGFGLFGNLTIRNPTVASKLNSEGFKIIALGETVLNQHPSRPDVSRAVIQTIRNVATQDEPSAAELRESEIFSKLRRLILEHEAEGRWKHAVDISRQLLREFRADEGVQKAPQFNAYY